MRTHMASALALSCLVFLAAPTSARAQGDTRFVVEVGVGLDVPVNGNVNSGAIGRLQGQAVAILPNTYGDVYGTGVQLRFGGGYVLDEFSELRGMFTYQSADAELVRLGDIGPSSLYGQYSDYKVFGFDFGYRRYMPIQNAGGLRLFGEGTIGLAAIDRINVLLAAPQSNLIFEQTDFFDGTAAFTWTLSGGVVFPIAERVDVTGQIGLRHVGGLADVDAFEGTGLDEINDDTARLTFPVVVGVRFRF